MHMEKSFNQDRLSKSDYLHISKVEYANVELRNREKLLADIAISKIAKARCDLVDCKPLPRLMAFAFKCWPAFRPVLTQVFLFSLTFVSPVAVLLKPG